MWNRPEAAPRWNVTGRLCGDCLAIQPCSKDEVVSCHNDPILRAEATALGFDISGIAIPYQPSRSPS